MLSNEDIYYLIADYIEVDTVPKLTYIFAPERDEASGPVAGYLAYKKYSDGSIKLEIYINPLLRDSEYFEAVAAHELTHAKQIETGQNLKIQRAVYGKIFLAKLKLWKQL